MLRGTEHFHHFGIQLHAIRDQIKILRTNTQNFSLRVRCAYAERALHIDIRDEIHRGIANEAAHKAAGRIGVHLMRRVVLHDLAAMHHGDTIRQTHRFGLIMRDIDRGRFERAQQAL